jgi:hypothetical protein
MSKVVIKSLFQIDIVMNMTFIYDIKLSGDIIIKVTVYIKGIIYKQYVTCDI